MVEPTVFAEKMRQLPTRLRELGDDVAEAKGTIVGLLDEAKGLPKSVRTKTRKVLAKLRNSLDIRVRIINAQESTEPEKQRQKRELLAEAERSCSLAGDYLDAAADLDAYLADDEIWSRPRSPKEWLLVFKILGEDCASIDTFRRRRDDGTYKEKPGSTTKSVSLSLDCLPSDYSDNMSLTRSLRN